MNTKIWLEELSLGSNFGNLRAFGSNRVWCYFLVHTFKIKKFESISSNGSRDIAKSLKISFGSNFGNLRAFGSKFWQFRFPVYTFQINSIICTRSWVLVYITFAHGRTDGRTDIFRKSFLFFSWSRIYIHVYTYLDYFSNFTPLWPKLVYLFSILEISMKILTNWTIYKKWIHYFSKTIHWCFDINKWFTFFSITLPYIELYIPKSIYI